MKIFFFKFFKMAYGLSSGSFFWRQRLIEPNSWKPGPIECETFLCHQSPSPIPQIHTRKCSFKLFHFKVCSRLFFFFKKNITMEISIYPKYQRMTIFRDFHVLENLLKIKLVIYTQLQVDICKRHNSYSFTMSLDIYGR